MPTPIETKVKEFEEKFNDLGKYNSDELNILNFNAERFLAQKDFLESALKDTWNSALGAVEREMPPELVSEVDLYFEGNSWNAYRSETLEIIKKMKL